MPDAERRPLIVLTAILDGSARPATVTVSHGDAMVRALEAIGSHDVIGPEIIELTVPPQAFGALRRWMRGGPELVALYDVFPLNPALSQGHRRVAAQFLSAERLWAMEEQGLLEGFPLNLRLDLPRGWDKDPKAIHEKLVGAGALDLDEAAVEAFKAIKTAWDASAPNPAG
jgi:hypothetical protein